MAHWNAAPLDRRQATLFNPTLDDGIADNHPVRLFDEVLGEFDFAGWESDYVLVVGQPPIHPGVLARCILYGLSLGIRASRKLEDACINRVDFMWLMDGRHPDHSTLCDFRLRFQKPLKELFRKVGRVAMEMGMVTLNQVTLDGTDIRANNSRYQTGRRPSLERKLALLDEQINQAMAQAAEQDKSDDRLYGVESSPARLPADLKDLNRRRAKRKQAMARLEKIEREQADRGERSSRGPAVPLVDVDSRVLPNKTGGYAPNYTAVLAVDGDSGIILDSQILGGNDEASAVANIQESFDRKPAQLLADSGFNTGPNLAALSGQGVEPLMPERQKVDSSVVAREDLSQPVPEEKRDALPMNPQNKVLDKAAFVYVESGDCYICPMGKTLNYTENKKYDRHGKKGVYRVYQCGDCAGCPLAARCLAKQATERRICRDEYEKHREEMSRRLCGEAGKAQYRRRAHVAETPHAAIKTRMNFRQFLLRGQRKVEQEWRWATTAYNLMKLMVRKAMERAQGSLPAPVQPA
jgi:transposase